MAVIRGQTLVLGMMKACGGDKSGPLATGAFRRSFYIMGIAGSVDTGWRSLLPHF